MSRFVVFLQGRTGSTYLVEALDSHPRIHCENERLIPMRKRGPQAQIDWARTYLEGSAEPNVAAIGFKTKLADILDKSGFKELLHDVNAQAILLKRRNLAKMVVSWFNSERLYEATGDWNLYPGAPSPPPFEVDIEEFERRLSLVTQGQAALETYVRELGLPLLTLYYEDLLLAKAAVFQRVAAFLQVPYQPMQGNCIKSTNDDLRKVVTNFEALARRYQGTPYQQMLCEVLLPSGNANGAGG